MINIDQFVKNLIINQKLAFSTSRAIKSKYFRKILTKDILYDFIIVQNLSCYYIYKKLLPKIKITPGIIIDIAKQNEIKTKSIYDKASKLSLQLRRNTLKQRYGVQTPLCKQSPFYQKRNKTVKLKYGVDNVFQLQEVKNKSKQSLIKNYGVQNSRYLPWWRGNNGQRSKYHIEVENILKQLNINFISEYGKNKHNGPFSKFNESLNKMYSPTPDIYIPIKNIIIEIYSDTYHANPLKFKDQDIIRTWQGNKLAKEIRQFDKIRKEHLQSFGVKVIQIWVSDIKCNKKQVIKMLKNKLIQEVDNVI